jgi:hypothetical protein
LMCERGEFLLVGVGPRGVTLPRIAGN